MSQVIGLITMELCPGIIQGHKNYIHVTKIAYELVTLSVNRGYSHYRKVGRTRCLLAVLTNEVGTDTTPQNTG
jgi:hypothetical protein